MAANTRIALIYDQRRDRFLHEQGFAVLRFWNHQVLGQTDAVLEAIFQAALSPNPSPASGRGGKIEAADGDEEEDDGEEN